MGRKFNGIQPAAGEPEMPAFLCDRARAEWARLVPILLGIGTLTIADGNALAMYCTTLVDLEDAQAEIRKHGVMIQQPMLSRGAVLAYWFKLNPAVTVRNQLARELRQLARDLGLKPGREKRKELSARYKVMPNSKELSPSDRQFLRECGIDEQK
jgi:P27 family predicted phage terminase small subunit